VAATFTFTASGMLASSSGTATTPLLYAGSYFDAASNFYYLVHRYYDPQTGQFLNVDPLVHETGQPYAYTGDDPVNAIDPLGMITCGGWLSWVPGCGTATAIQH
jgi:RHS repeat-associated protein